MGYLQKALNGFFVEGVHVGLIVEYGSEVSDLPPYVPQGTLGVLALREPFVGGEALVFVQHHVKAGQEVGVGAVREVRVAGEGNVSLAVFLVLGDVAAAVARGPLVLVVEPGQHLILLGVIGAGLDQLHEVVGEVGGGHAGSAMHMESAQPHFLENIDLTEEFLLLQIAVPGPERGSPIFGGGVGEQAGIQGGRFSVFLVEHIAFPICHRGVFGMDTGPHSGLWVHYTIGGGLRQDFSTRK